MAELEELEQEDLDAQLLEVGNPVADDLRSVPSAEPKGKFAHYQPNTHVLILSSVTASNISFRVWSLFG